jgi:hypothetical protein
VTSLSFCPAGELGIKLLTVPQNSSRPDTPLLNVAAHGGCTIIPLAAVGAQEDETILEDGYLGHAKVRFVHPDSPGLIRSWKIEDLVSLIVKRLSSPLPR